MGLLTHLWGAPFLAQSGQKNFADLFQDMQIEDMVRRAAGDRNKLVSMDARLTQSLQ